MWVLASRRCYSASSVLVLGHRRQEVFIVLGEHRVHLGELRIEGCNFVAEATIPRGSAVTSLISTMVSRRRTAENLVVALQERRGVSCMGHV